MAVRAEALAKAGAVSEALHLVRRLPEAICFSGWAWQKTTALIAIATAYFEQGRPHEARLSLDAARVSSESLREGGDCTEADCLSAIAGLLLKMGERREAIATWMTAARLARPHQVLMDCVKTLVRIATALLEIGEVDRAEEVAQMIRASRSRDLALRDIAMRTRGGGAAER